MHPEMIVDYRERKIIPLLEKTMEFEVKNLPVGDFLILKGNSCMLVERKDAVDFVQSMLNNRLWEQMRRMLVDEVMGIKVARRALVIHGSISEAIEEREIGWNNVMGAIMDIQYNYRIPVFHAEDDDALLEFLKIAVKREYTGKNEEGVKELWARPIPKKGMSDDDWRVYVLSSLPFVGEKLARKMLEHFGTIEKIARANIVELKKVPGIGDKNARRIYRVFH